MSRNDKLFRAIVVMGAAITASACGDDGKCAKCEPVPDAIVATVDAGVDGPTDAPVDVVLIL